MPGEFRAIADTGQHQYLGRIHGTRGEDDLAIGPDRNPLALAHIFDAWCRVSLEDEPGHLRAGAHFEVGSFARRPKVGIRGRAPQAVAHGDLVDRSAVLFLAVVVRVEGNARSLGRFQIIIGERVRGSRHVGDGQRTTAAAPLVRAGEIVFHALVDRQNVACRPAGIAEGCPRIEILVLPAHIDHRIDRARSADHLAARPVARTVADPRNHLGEIAPVHFRMIEGLAVTDRHLDPEIEIAAAGFQKQDARFRIDRKAIGEHAACRAGADDDEIELLPLRHAGHPVSPSCPMLLPINS